MRAYFVFPEFFLQLVVRPAPAKQKDDRDAQIKVSLLQTLQARIPSLRGNFSEWFDIIFFTNDLQLISCINSLDQLQQCRLARCAQNVKFKTTPGDSNQPHALFVDPTLLSHWQAAVAYFSSLKHQPEGLEVVQLSLRLILYLNQTGLGLGSSAWTAEQYFLPSVDVTILLSCFF